MAINASADSEIPREAASAVKQSFSSNVGRAVIEARRAEMTSPLTERAPRLQQNADVSLSCHQIESTPRYSIPQPAKERISRQPQTSIAA
jgi:hypothetical protein